MNKRQKENLINNWGERAEALACRAEVRVYDPLSLWECFIFALNPYDEDTIKCVIRGACFSEVTEWSLLELNKCYNSEGERPEEDLDFRPIDIQQILKRSRDGCITH